MRLSVFRSHFAIDCFSYVLIQPSEEYSIPLVFDSLCNKAPFQASQIQVSNEKNTNLIKSLRLIS